MKLAKLKTVGTPQNTTIRLAMRLLTESGIAISDRGYTRLGAESGWVVWAGLALVEGGSGFSLRGAGVVAGVGSDSALALRRFPGSKGKRSRGDGEGGSPDTMDSAP